MPNPNQKTPGRIASARRLRQRQFFVNVDGEYFRVRKADMPSLLMEGVIPAPLLQAADSLQQYRQKIEAGDIGSMINVIQSKEWNDSIAMMRACIVSFVLEPKLTHSKKEARENPDLLWIGGRSDIEGEESNPEETGDLAMADILTLWSALMGEHRIIVMSEEEARDFRTREHAPIDSAVLPSEDDRTETVGSGAAVVPAVPETIDTGEVPELATR
jgi:hypothetical protein